MTSTQDPISHKKKSIKNQTNKQEQCKKKQRVESPKESSEQSSEQSSDESSEESSKELVKESANKHLRVCVGPRSPWVCFLLEKKTEKKFSLLKYPDLCKVMSPIWKSMSEEEKKPYFECYQRDLNRYKFTVNHFSQDQKQKHFVYRRQMKTKKREGQLKRPRSSFIIFQEDQRPHFALKYPQLTCIEIAKKIGEEWRQLTEEQKEPWKQRQKLETNQYTSQKKSSIATSSLPPI